MMDSFRSACNCDEVEGERHDQNNSNSLSELLSELIKKPELIIKKRNLILNNRHKFFWSIEKEKYSNLIQKFRNGR